jgi:hypothetical protein
MPKSLDEILRSPPLSRIRRNHALEHATIHLLSRRYPRTFFIGRSDAGGFYMMGDVPTEAIRQAAMEALDRLLAGEVQLAVHPNCGTSFVTAGALAGGAAYLTLLGGRDRRWNDRLARLPLVILAATLALIAAQPLGLALQRRLTTESDLAGLRILGVRRLSKGRAVVHRVLTTG